MITCGYASTPTYQNDGIPFISAKNVKPYKFIYSNYKFICQELFNKIHANYKPSYGDILLTRVGAGIGEACIIDNNETFGIYVSVTLIKVIKYLNNIWILHLLQSPYGHTLSNKKTSGKNASQGNLNVDNVRNFLVPIPSFNEQQKIVKLVNIINENLK